MCTSSIYKRDSKWGLNFNPSCSPLKWPALDEKHPEVLSKLLILNIWGQILFSWEKKEIVSQADKNHLLPVATEQESSKEQDVHSTGTWQCWLIPGDPIRERHRSWTQHQEAHGRIVAGMLQPSHSAFCCKQHSRVHVSAMTSLFHCKNDVRLQSLALKRKEQKS